MIEKQTIDGREAMVAYLTAQFRPAEKDEADLVKVIFDDGETVFLTPPTVGSLSSQSANLDILEAPPR